MSGFLNRLQRSIAGHEKSDGDGSGSGVIANLGHTLASAIPRLSQADAGRGSHPPTDQSTEDGQLTMEAYQKLQLQTRLLQQRLEAAQHLRLENERLKAALESANVLAGTSQGSSVGERRPVRASEGDEVDIDVAKLRQANKQLHAKIELLRGNLVSARQEAEESVRLRESVDLLKQQLEAAAPPPDTAQLQAENRQLKQQLASRALQADQKLQAQLADLKKQLAAKSTAPTDERLQQEVRALRQQLNNRQAAAARAAELEAQVWRLTSQLQAATAAQSSESLRSQKARGPPRPEPQQQPRGLTPQIRRSDSPPKRESPHTPAYATQSSVESLATRTSQHPPSMSNAPDVPSSASPSAGPSPPPATPVTVAAPRAGSSEIEAATPPPRMVLSGQHTRASQPHSRVSPTPAEADVIPRATPRGGGLARTGSMEVRRSTPPSPMPPAQAAQLIRAAAQEAQALHAENEALKRALEAMRGQLEAAQRVDAGPPASALVQPTPSFTGPEGSDIQHTRNTEDLAQRVSFLEGRLRDAEAALEAASTASSNAPSMVEPDPSTAPSDTALPLSTHALVRGPGDSPPTGPSSRSMTDPAKLLAELEAARRETEEVRCALDAARRDAEAAQREVEAVRGRLQAALADAEVARADAEVARADAEGARADTEGARADAENAHAAENASAALVARTQADLEEARKSEAGVREHLDALEAAHTRVSTELEGLKAAEAKWREVAQLAERSEVEAREELARVQELKNAEGAELERVREEFNTLARECAEARSAKQRAAAAMQGGVENQVLEARIEELEKELYFVSHMTAEVPSQPIGQSGSLRVSQQSSRSHSPSMQTPREPRGSTEMATRSGHLVLNDNPAFDEGAGTPATMSLASDSGPEGDNDEEPDVSDIPSIRRKFKRMDAKEIVRRSRRQLRETTLGHGRQQRDSSSARDQEMEFLRAQLATARIRLKEVGVEDGDAPERAGSGRHRSQDMSYPVGRSPAELEMELAHCRQALNAEREKVETLTRQLTDVSSQLESAQADALEHMDAITRLMQQASEAEQKWKSAMNQVEALSQQVQESSGEALRAAQAAQVNAQWEEAAANSRMMHEQARRQEQEQAHINAQQHAFLQDQAHRQEQALQLTLSWQRQQAFEQAAALGLDAQGANRLQQMQAAANMAIVEEIEPPASSSAIMGQGGFAQFGRTVSLPMAFFKTAHAEAHKGREIALSILAEKEKELGETLQLLEDAKAARDAALHDLQAMREGRYHGDGSASSSLATSPSHGSASVAQYQQLLHALQQQEHDVQTLQTENANLRTAVQALDEMRTQANRCFKERNELVEACRALQAKGLNLQKQFHEASQHHTKTEQEMAALYQVNEGLRGQVAGLQKELSLSEDNDVKLRARLEELQKCLENMQKDKQFLDEAWKARSAEAMQLSSANEQLGRVQATLKARDAQVKTLLDQLAAKEAELASVRTAAQDRSVGGWSSGEGVPRPAQLPAPPTLTHPALPPVAPPAKPAGGPNEISISPFAAMQGFPSSSESESEEDEDIDSRAPSPTSNGAPSTPRTGTGRGAALMYGGSGRMSMSREMSMEVGTRPGHARALEDIEGLLSRRTGELQAATRQVASLNEELDAARRDTEEVRGELQRAYAARQTAEATSLTFADKAETFRQSMCEAGDHIVRLLKEKKVDEASLQAKDRLIRELEGKLAGSSQSEMEAVSRIAALEALSDKLSIDITNLGRALSARDAELAASVTRATKAEADAAEAVAQLEQAAKQGQEEIRKVRAELAHEQARAEHAEKEAHRLGSQGQAAEQWGRQLSELKAQAEARAAEAEALANKLLQEKTQKCCEKCTARTEECEKLKALAESAKQEAAAKTQECERCKALAESAEREAAALQESMEGQARMAQEATARADAAETKARDAETKLESAMLEVKKAVKRVAWTETELERLRACCDQRARELEEAAAQATSAEGQVQALTEALSAKSDEVEDLQARLATAEEETSATREAWEKSCAGFEQDTTRIQQLLHAELEKAVSNAVQAQQESAALKEAVVGRSAELTEEKARAADLQKTLDGQTIELEGALTRLAELGSQSAALEQALEGRTRELEQSMGHATVLEAALNEKALELDGAVARAEQLEMVLATKAAELEEVSAKAVCLEGVLGERATQLEEARAQVSGLKAELEEKTAQLGVSLARVGTLEKALEDRTCELAEAIRQAETMEEQSVTLTETLASKSAQLEHSLAHAAGLDREIRQPLEEQLAAITTALDAKSTEVEEAIARCGALEEALEAQTAETKQTVIDLRAAEEGRVALRNALHDKSADLDQVREALRDKSADLQEVREALDDKSADLDQVCEALREKSAELDQVREALHDKSADVDQANRRLEGAKHQGAGLQETQQHQADSEGRVAPGPDMIMEPAGVTKSGGIVQRGLNGRAAERENAGGADSPQPGTEGETHASEMGNLSDVLAQLAEAQAEAMQLRAEAEEARRAGEESAQGLSGCEDEREKLTKALEEAQKELEALRRESDLARAEANTAHVHSVEGAASPDELEGIRARLAEAVAEVSAATERANAAEARATDLAGLLRDAEANVAALQVRLADAEAWLADAMRAKETRAAKEASRAAEAEAEAAHQHAMLRASQDQVEALMLKLEASQASATVLTQELQTLSAEREVGPPADALERETLQARLAEALAEVETLKADLATCSTPDQAEEAAALAKGLAIAEEKQAQAQQEKQVLQEQFQKLEKGWQEERTNLMNKLERLHKSNKDKRDELQQLKEGAAEARQQAAFSVEATSVLQQAEAEVEALRQKVGQAETLALEADALRAALALAEERMSAGAAALKEAEAAAEVARGERDEVQQQVMLLGAAKAEKETLAGRVAGLERDLASAAAAHEAARDAQAAADAAEAVAARARTEVASGLAARSELEEKLLNSKKDLAAAQGLLAEERRLRAEAARRYARESEAWAHQPLEALPPHVRQLLDTHLQSALNAAKEQAAADMEAAEVAQTARLELLEQEKQSAEDAQRQAEAAREEAEQRTANLTRELEEREGKLQEKLEEAEARVEAAEREGEEAVARLAKEVDDVVDHSRKEITNWKAKCEKMERELGEVKQRAVDLLEEKEQELRAAQGLPQGRVRENLPSSSQPGTTGALHTDSAHLTASQGMEPNPRRSGEGPRPGSAPTGGQAPQMAALAARVAQLEAALVESDNTHRLRDRAQEVAKEEINELRRQITREGVSTEYLKGVLVGAFESGELPRTSNMLPVLARLLEFSPADMERISKPKRKGASRPPSSPHGLRRT